MTARVRRGGLVALSVVACTMGLAAQRPPAAPATGLIVGQVVDGVTGRPIGQTMVTLGAMAGGSIRQSVPTRILTGSDGRFVFRDLPAGSYTVMARKAGFLAGTSGTRSPGGTPQAVLLSATNSAADVPVRMWKAASISGTVTDESGEPLVRVQIAVLRKLMTGGRPRFTPVSHSMTDDRGMYRVGDLIPGQYLVATSAPPRAFSLAVAREVAPHGGPGIQVDDFIIQLGDGIPTPPPPDVGRLRVYPLTFYPGTESATQAGVITLRAGEEYGVADLQLRPSGVAAVRGRVIGPDPGAAPLLQLLRTDVEAIAPDMSGALTPTSLDGEFLFPTVPEGDYTLRVIATTQGGASLTRGAPRTVVWAADPVAVGGADVHEVIVTLRDGLQIRGHAEFEGARPAPGAGLLQRIPIAVEPAFGQPLLTTEGGASFVVARGVGASGNFVIPNLPGGSYIVRVTNSPPGWMFSGAMYGGRDISTEAVEVTSDLDGVVLRFTDRWTGVQGTVRRPDGLPDPDATVFVFPLDPAAWEGYGPTPRRLRVTRPAANGNYAIDSLPPGNYYAIALREEPFEWRDPSVLQQLSRSAQRLAVRADGKTTLDLRSR